MASTTWKRGLSAHDVLTCWWADARALIQYALTLVVARSRIVIASFTGLLALVWAVLSFDLPMLDSIRLDTRCGDHRLVDEIARALSYWGDFLGFNMMAFVLIGAAATLRRSLFFRQVMLAAVISTILAGGTANVLRVSTGRARPGSGVVAGFYGPQLSARLQSFPSAHTATSFGASVPVAVAVPAVGVPMLVISAAVAWSRMQNNCHHPTDVLVSIALAIFFGWPLGMAVRRMRQFRGASLAR